MNKNLSDALCRLGEAAASAARALLRCYNAFADAVGAIFESLDVALLLKSARVQVALKEAPPRVRHLANNHKKRRVRKKNINRALRDYERRHRNGEV